MVQLLDIGGAGPRKVSKLSVVAPKCLRQSNAVRRQGKRKSDGQRRAHSPASSRISAIADLGRGARIGRQFAGYLIFSHR